MSKDAFNTVKESYDIDTLREIVEHGCASGVAHQHIYYSDTIKFFDNYEDEIIEYIADTLGVNSMRSYGITIHVIGQGIRMTQYGHLLNL